MYIVRKLGIYNIKCGNLNVLKHLHVLCTCLFYMQICLKIKLYLNQEECKEMVIYLRDLLYHKPYTQTT